MSALVWDQTGERIYESGVDRGVLYLPSGLGVAWNGLTSVVEETDTDVTPVHYDGLKIMDLVTVGDATGKIKAFTYPDELLELEGVAEVAGGLFVASQQHYTFGLSYRTKIGSDVDADAGYKLHILYNVTAVPSATTFDTIGDSADFAEFQWDITTVPEEIAGFRPTAHVILDSRKVDPAHLSDLEGILYGTVSTDPALISLTELAAYAFDGFLILIADNGDDTWTATSLQPGVISVNVPEAGVVTITGTAATFISADEFQISTEAL